MIKPLDLYTTVQVSRMLACSESKIRHLITTDKLDAYKLSTGMFLISQDSINLYKKLNKIK